MREPTPRQIAVRLAVVLLLALAMLGAGLALVHEDGPLPLLPTSGDEQQ